jgi:alkylation response protein AidB-like acyl-CoA dehydrogenase
MAALDDLRIDIRQLLTEHFRPDATVRSWWAALADAGLTAPNWPKPFGRGLSSEASRIVTEELVKAGAIAPPQGGVGMRMAGPTLLAHGTEEQKETYLWPLLRGEESWCQLFSEPGAGSDLPILSTKALLDGDEFVISGQKVWNSAADLASRGMLLARTNADVPKREGITFFLLDMDQPGVEVRPLRQMNGEASFCEVFMTEVRATHAEILGEIDAGWTVARTLVSVERGATSERAARGLIFLASGAIAGNLDRTVGEVLGTQEQGGTRFSGSAIPSRAMFQLAREAGPLSPTQRDGLVRYWVLTEVHKLNLQRARQQTGGTGAEGSIGKLMLGKICNASRDLSFSLLGPAATLAGDSAPYGGEIQTVGLSSPGVTIGAGTDEIQRNTMAERILGLPREEDPSANIPFKETTSAH